MSPVPLDKSDFTLLFKADGTVELLNDKQQSVWTSDNDEEFMEEFDGETFFSDENDSEDIIAYLHEQGIVDAEEHDIDIVENDLEDETDDDDDDDDDTIDGEYEELH